MSGTKKYYWLKFPQDFFEQPENKILESLPDGKDAILLYIKLMCKAIETEGRLIFRDGIPYTDEMLSALTGTDLEIVKKSLQMFDDFGMITRVQDGSYFIPRVEQLLGCETQWAKYKREERKGQKMENVQTCPNDVQTKSQKSPTEKELDKEIDKDNIKDIVGQAPTPPPYKVIIDYLNQKTNSHYQSTTKSTQTKINARIKEGATIEDFMLVIDLKSSQWMGDKKMEAYLRPETLFAASHFESYLNEAKRSATAKPKHSGVSQRLAAEVSVDVDDYNEFD